MAKKEKKIILIAILILAIIIIALIALLPKNNQNSKNQAECRTDSDCIKQQLTCCPCSMGGQEACMSRENASFYQERLKICEIKDLACIALYNCGQDSCKCVEGKCI